MALTAFGRCWLRKKLIGLHTRLTGHAMRLLFTENAQQLLRRHRLVRPVADPGLCDMSKACRLATGHQPTQAAALLAAAEQTGEDATHRGRSAATTDQAAEHTPEEEALAPLVTENVRSE